MLIPDDYINNIQERLKIYTELDGIENEEALEKFISKITDRFGKMPVQVKELVNGLKVRWLCKKLGFERLSLKGNKLRAYFLGNAQSSFFESKTFQDTLAYVAKHSQHKQITMKQSPRFLILIKERIRNLKEARIFLEGILVAIDKK